MCLGAVIAAAGLSSRMGAFKPLLPLGGSTFIERIINTLRAGGEEHIVVVTGRDAALITNALAAYKHIDFVYNKDFCATDMFYSASLGLRRMAEQADGIFFTPVDIPLFSAETVRLLAGLLENDDAPDIAVPSCLGKSGHPIAMTSSAAKELIRYTGPGGLKGAIAAYGGQKSVVETGDPGILYDSDTPQDYRLLLRTVKKNEQAGVLEL